MGEARAEVNYIRISSQKMRLVANVVRGRQINQALNYCKMSPKKGSKILLKLLNSAVANAGQDKTIDVDNLLVKTIIVNDGPRMWRIRPRARGRATWYQKKTSKIRVILSEPE